MISSCMTKMHIFLKWLANLKINKTKKYTKLMTKSRWKLISKRKRKQPPKSMRATNTVAMVMDITHRKSTITTLRVTIRRIVVTRRCTIVVLIRSITRVMCKGRIGNKMKRRLRIILDFMVMRVENIPRMNSMQIENRPKKTMISIQDLKMP